jgi:hypothetical protein
MAEDNALAVLESLVIQGNASVSELRSDFATFEQRAGKAVLAALAELRAEILAAIKTEAADRAADTTKILAAIGQSQEALTALLNQILQILQTVPNEITAAEPTFSKNPTPPTKPGP